MPITANRGIIGAKGGQLIGATWVQSGTTRANGTNHGQLGPIRANRRSIGALKPAYFLLCHKITLIKTIQQKIMIPFVYSALHVATQY